MKYLVGFLYWLVRVVIIVFWILDILNMPFMVQFDTVYPLNTLFWLLVFIFIPTMDAKININYEE